MGARITFWEVSLLKQMKVEAALPSSGTCNIIVSFFYYFFLNMGMRHSVPYGCTYSCFVRVCRGPCEMPEVV